MQQIPFFLLPALSTICGTPQYLGLHVIHEHGEVGGVAAEAGGRGRFGVNDLAALAWPTIQMLAPGDISQGRVIHACLALSQGPAAVRATSP